MKCALDLGFTVAAIVLIAADEAGFAIKPGDTVVVGQEGAALLVGDEVLARLPKGTEISVAEVRGDWVGTAVESGGKKHVGWLRRSELRAAYDEWGVAGGGLRTWTDPTGKYKVEAELAGFKDGKVKLRKTDGVLLSVPITRLCEADQQFVRARLDEAASKPPARPAAPKGARPEQSTYGGFKGAKRVYYSRGFIEFKSDKTGRIERADAMFDDEDRTVAYDFDGNIYVKGRHAGGDFKENWTAFDKGEVRNGSERITARESCPSGIIQSIKAFTTMYKGKRVDEHGLAAAALRFFDVLGHEPGWGTITIRRPDGAIVSGRAIIVDKMVISYTLDGQRFIRNQDASGKFLAGYHRAN